MGCCDNEQACEPCTPAQTGNGFADFWSLAAEVDAATFAAHMKALVADRHPAVQDIARFFTWGHLADLRAEVAMAYAKLAYWTIASLPDSPQLTLALHDLQRAKDAAVRASLPR